MTSGANQGELTQIRTSGPSATAATGAVGALEVVDPRSIWPREDLHFTPWLLENALVLGEALGIELELTRAEHPVGAYWLDLIGEDKSHGVTLIVENQLAQSDHIHLGQLLTYAAGTEASSVVWITTQFRDEHRQALTWLNEHTDENTHFFGVELQTVRIGDSLPAPLFKVVAKPNDWGKAVKASVSGQSGIRAELYRTFWSRYLDRLRVVHPDWTRGTPPAGNVCWMSAKFAGIGHVSVFASNSTIRQDLVIDRATFAESHAVFDWLLSRRSSIEERYGKCLEWDTMENRKSCRISDQQVGDISREEDYESYIQFFIDSSERFRRAFVAELADASRVGDEALALAINLHVDSADLDG